MECPCDIGVVRSPDHLKGTTSTLGSFSIYTASPSPDKTRHAGVIVAYDIFGFAVPNTKYIADHLASQGFETIMPDFYHGEGWSEDKTSELATPKFTEWISKFRLTNEEYRAKFVEDVKVSIKYLKETKGCKKVAMIGFCWGGTVSSYIAGTGLIDAAVSIHGSGHSGQEVEGCKSPIYYITVEGDRSFPAAKIEEIQKAFEDKKGVGGIKVYGSPAHHGFVNRGKFDDPVMQKLADEAMAVTTEFLITHTK